MNALFSARLLRLFATLIPLIVLAGCGEGDGPQRTQNQPADPFAGPPASCAEAITFEDICDQVIEFFEFEGGPGRIIDNPDQSGINTSAKVAELRKERATSGATFGGTVVSFESLGAVQLNAGDMITVKVWSQRMVNVLFEPEGGGPGSGEELVHGGTGWEELTFTLNFTGSTSGYVFIFDNGTNGNATADPLNWTFYVDDISLPMGGGGPGPGPGTFPVTFDEATPPAVTEFGGAGFAIEAGPAGGDGNALKISRDGGDNFAGVFVTVPNIPNDQGEQTITAFVYSPTADIPMVVKAEYGENMGTGDVSANETVVVGWQTLSWTFTNLEPGNVYNRFVILPNLGTVDTATDYYFDNIFLVGGEPPEGCDDGITFEVECGFEYGYTDFEGGVATVVDNPDQAGINPSAKVVQMQKFRADSGATFGGSTLTFSPPRDALDVMAGSSFSVKVWSQRAVNVLFQPEPAGPGNDVEVAHGGTGWEELTFNLGSFADTVTGWTFIFDNGTLGDAEADPTNWTFYYDDIFAAESGGGGPGPGGFPLTFDEATPPEVTEFGGAGWAIEPGPAGGDGNALKIVRDGGDVFAGVFVTIPEIPNDQGDQTMSALVYSPTAGIPMVVKAEYGENMGTGDVSANETVVVGWQTLTWTFTNLAPGNAYNRFVILPNLGTVDTATDYFFDNIDLVGDGGGNGGATSTDFESGSAMFTDFEGGVATVIDNPDASGINTSSKVAQMEKFAGQPFAGSTLDLGGTVPLADGDSYIMKVRASRSVVVTLKLEPQGDESTATHSGSGTWEELCFDFAGVSGDVTGLTLIFDNGTVGDAANDPDNWTFQFDDIEQTSAACPTGGGGGDALGPIDFEPNGQGEAFSWTVFENGDNPPLTVIDNPDATGANTSGRVAQFTARQAGQPFAGTVTADLPTFTLDASNAIVKMKVWKSVISDVGIKFENAATGSTGEVKVANTVTNQWEELTFDFSAVIGDPNNTDITALVIFPDFDARTQENVIYFDEISFSAVSGGGGTGSFVNGDFETGDFTGWTLTQDPSDRGSIALDSSGQGGRAGTVARLIAAGDATGTNDVLIGQVALGAGTIAPGDSIDVSFDLYGSLTGAGGVVFVEVIFLNAAGEDEGGRNFVGPAAPYVPTTTWTTHSGTVIAGVGATMSGWDVSGGVTLELKAACGAIMGGCGVDASFDNVTFTITGGGG